MGGELFVDLLGQGPLIWSTRVRRTAVMARVMCTVAVVPAAPRGAAISRACSTAGSVRPQ
jgi:hypothetical protein